MFHVLTWRLTVRLCDQTHVLLPILMEHPGVFFRIVFMDFLGYSEGPCQINKLWNACKEATCGICGKHVESVTWTELLTKTFGIRNKRKCTCGICVTFFVNTMKKQLVLFVQSLTIIIYNNWEIWFAFLLGFYNASCFSCSAFYVATFSATFCIAAFWSHLLCCRLLCCHLLCCHLLARRLLL